MEENTINNILFFILIFLKTHAFASEKIIVQNHQAKERRLSTINWIRSAPQSTIFFQQQFLIAQEKIDFYDKMSSARPKAIIVDLDETIIDNSKYFESLTKDQEHSYKNINKWMQQAQGQLFPGAKRFLNYTRKKKIQIIYVTSRLKKTLFKPTLTLLRKLEVPFDIPNLYMNEGHGKKKDVFNHLEKKYTILLILGDQITDFPDSDKNKDYEFGKKFLLFPNLLYGNLLNDFT